MSPVRNRLVPSALALIVGLVVGAVAAFAVRGGFTVVSQEDPCYGYGELISTRPWTISEDTSEENLEFFTKALGPLTRGETRELRVCGKQPFDTFLIDGPTGTMLDHYINIEEAVAYYQEHPEEMPAYTALEASEERDQQSFVPAEVPSDLTAGCDPSWVTTTFEGVQAAMCHPAGWKVTSDRSGRAGVGTATVNVGVLGLSIGSHYTKCSSPTLVDVPSGTARVCAVPITGHDLESIMHYGIALPNGRNLAVNVYEEATPGEEALALRVAANVESLLTFVPADVPTDLTARCDPSWVVMTFERVQAVMCHPPTSLVKQELWGVSQHNPVSAAVGNGTVQVAVLGIGIASPVTPCPAPTLVEVPSGTAEVCAVDTSSMAGRRSMYGVTLPNGREVAVTVSAEGTADDEETALRIAANVGSLP